MSDLGGEIEDMLSEEKEPETIEELEAEIEKAAKQSSIDDFKH